MLRIERYTLFAPDAAGDDARKAALEMSQAHLAAVNDLLATVASLQGRVRELMPEDSAAGPSFEDAVDVDSLALDSLDPFMPGAVGGGSSFFDASSLGASVASLAGAQPAGDADAARSGDAADSETGVMVMVPPPAAVDAPVQDDTTEGEPLPEVHSAVLAQPAAAVELLAAVEPAMAGVPVGSAVPSADIAALRAALGGVPGASEPTDEEHEASAEAEAMALAIELSLQQHAHVEDGTDKSAQEAGAGTSAIAAPSGMEPGAAASLPLMGDSSEDGTAAKTAPEAVPAGVPIVAVQHEVEDEEENQAESPASQSSSAVMLPAHDDWTIVDDDAQAIDSLHALPT